MGWDEADLGEAVRGDEEFVETVVVSVLEARRPLETEKGAA